MLLKSFVEDQQVSVCFPDNSISETRSFPTDFFNSTNEDTNGLILLYFYLGDFTSICSMELLAFHRRYADFESLNCHVVACSVNGAEVHAAWKNTPKSKGGLGIQINHPVIADTNRSLCRAFDVLLPNRNVATRGWFLIHQSGEILIESRTDTKTARDVSQIFSMVSDVCKVLSTNRVYSTQV